MTREEAQRKAENLVFVVYTYGDIVAHCEMLGIKTNRKSRSYMEQKLIEALTEKYMHKEATT